MLLIIIRSSIPEKYFSNKNVFIYRLFCLEFTVKGREPFFILIEHSVSFLQIFNIYLLSKNMNNVPNTISYIYIYTHKYRLQIKLRMFLKTG